VQDWVDRLFGDAEPLDALQMSVRAVAVFALALGMIRASGRRSFGQRRPFDACTTVLLGATLSRAIVGAAPFWPVVCAAGTLVALHRLVGIASLRWPRFEQLVSGDKRELVRAGIPDVDEMRKGLITARDLDEAIRCKTGDEQAPVERAVLERDGKISIKTPDGS
jgi:uncharacterized membrane protein YcaP (DUF421 family)